MYERIDIAIHAALAVVAVGGLMLLLNDGRRRFLLSPSGYSLVVGAFTALVLAVLLEAGAHLLGERVSEFLAVAKHFLLSGAIVAFLLAFLRWMPAVEQLSQEVERLRAREHELQHLALHDQLTGLANRAFFSEQLSSTMQRADGRKTMAAILAADLDGFKEINDRFGHATGDAVLRDVAGRLKRGVRGEDLVARLSGDEFTVLAADVRAPGQVAALAQRLLDLLDRTDGTTGVAVNASIGIALYPQDGASADELLKQADFALYHAKTSGKGCYRFFDSAVEHHVRTQRRRLDEFERAVAQGELVVFYQPQVDASTGVLLGVEALVRWNHPEAGPLSRAAFIPLAEDARLMPAMDAWVVRRACRDAARWRAQGRPLRLAVNVSAQSVAPELVAAVADALQESGLTPAALEFEIVEATVLAASRGAAAALHQLAALGIKLAIDDFGTGYGSLVHWDSLPIDTIKIDRQFVQAVRTKRQATAIVGSILALEALELRVVAEGVEKPEQLTRLRELGCETAQGYLFSRPLPALELEQYMSAKELPDGVG